MKIEFDKEMIEWDVKNACYVISRRVSDGGDDDGELRALVADVAEGYNGRLLDRSLDKAFSDVAMAAGGIPVDGVKYAMEVEVPGSKSDIIARRLKELGRRYMVEQAVRDWLLTAYPSLSDGYIRAGRELLDELRGLRVWGKARLRPMW